MMNESKKKSFSIVIFSLAIIMFAIGYTKVSGATNMDDLESEKKQNEKNQSEYQQQASDLDESKSSLEGLVKDMNSELVGINQQIAQIDAQIAEKESQLVNTRNELDAAILLEKKQYKDMKLRIQFMFEMGDDTYFDILLSSSNIATSLNKAEYISQLVKYDRDQLKKYNDTMLAISQKESTYTDEQQDLVALKEQIKEQQQLVSVKISNAKTEIQAYQESIKAAESQALEYEKQVEEKNKAIFEESRRIEESSVYERQSKEQASREQASKLQAGNNNQGSNGEEATTTPYNPSSEFTYEATDSDIDMLAALIEAEAANQPYYGKLCVGAVVVNRMMSSSFPNTLTGVLYQQNAFTPVTVSNRFSIILARGANEECYRASREVLISKNIVGTWLFFRMNDGSRQGDVIGDHVFY